jgi:glyoxylase-like metal-dependent hydrolase (beta-lactamase superfamily II)
MTRIHKIEVPIPYPVKWVNCYYIEDSVPTLIDTGLSLPECFDALAEGVRKAGGHIGDLARVIVTHGHSDHSGLTGRIQEIGGAEIFVHVWDKAKLSNGPVYVNARTQALNDHLCKAGVPVGLVHEVVEKISGRFSNLIPPKACKPLRGGEVFGFDDFDLQVIHTPGHSPGSVCLYIEEKGLLFSGDTILEEVIADPMSDIKSLVEHHGSLQAISDLHVQKVFPGHGRPFSDHVRRIRRILDRQGSRSKRIQDIVNDSEESGEMTPFAIASKLFSPMEATDVFYYVSSVMAHLELLESKAKIG